MTEQSKLTDEQYNELLQLFECRYWEREAQPYIEKADLEHWLAPIIEAEVQRRIADMRDKPIGVVRDPLKQGARNHSIIVNLDLDLVKDNPEFQYSLYGTSVYTAPPKAQLQAAIDQAREEAAKICDDRSAEGEVDTGYESGGYEPEAQDCAERIRALIGKPSGDN